MSQKKLSPELFKFICFIVFIFISIGIGKMLDINPAELLTQLQNFFEQFSLFWTGVIFVFLYVVSTTLIWFGPKDVLRVLAALVFGAEISTLFVFLGELGNCFNLFHISRKFGRDYVQKKWKVRQEKLTDIQGKTSLFSIFTFRLNPLFPFRFLDLGYGLSRVSFLKYFAMVILASPIRIYWIQLLIAKMGTAAIKTPIPAMMIVMMNKKIQMITFGYAGLVFLLTLIAWIRSRYFKKYRHNIAVWMSYALPLCLFPFLSEIPLASKFLFSFMIFGICIVPLMLGSIQFYFGWLLMAGIIFMTLQVLLKAMPYILIQQNFILFNLGGALCYALISWILYHLFFVLFGKLFSKSKCEV